MGPPPRSFAADAHDCIMVRVLGPTEYKVVARLIRAPERGLPSDRHPDHIERAAVLGAVKVGLASAERVERLVRRPTLTAPARAGFAILAGRGEETGFQVEQRNRSRKQERKTTALKPLDNKSPIQGTRGMLGTSGGAGYGDLAVVDGMSAAGRGGRTAIWALGVEIEALIASVVVAGVAGARRV